MGMDEREIKALQIAATTKIIQKGADTWIVPSQTLKGRYAVTGTAEARECTCPDFELRQQACKHILALQLVLFRETSTETKPDGSTVTTVTEGQALKVTYGQPSWSRYNKAQINEKDLFVRLLRDLVADVQTPEQKGAGNRRMALSDAIFAATFKVYSGFSGRRFMSDLRSACADGFTGRAISYNALFKAMQQTELTPILHELVETTAAPLAGVETQFAVDSTGIGTECFYNHFASKWGKAVETRDFLKLHALVGTRTNVIAACEITDRNTHDTLEFKPLVERAAQRFAIKEVSADKAYSSVSNLEFVESIGATPYIPFKSNATADSKSKGRRTTKTWARLFHFFQMNKEEFLAHYHRRSASECTFSMLKRVIGDTLRSKHPVAQRNEALLMCVAHNIRCLIHEAFEAGFVPMLEQAACPRIAAAS